MPKKRSLLETSTTKLFNNDNCNQNEHLYSMPEVTHMYDAPTFHPLFELLILGLTRKSTQSHCSKWLYKKLHCSWLFSKRDLLKNKVTYSVLYKWINEIVIGGVELLMSESETSFWTTRLWPKKHNKIKILKEVKESINTENNGSINIADDSSNI